MRPFRATSPDGLTWEDYDLPIRGQCAVHRYERDHGETASRVWTKHMTKAEANRRALDLRDRYRWTVKRR